MRKVLNENLQEIEKYHEVVADLLEKGAHCFNRQGNYALLGVLLGMLRGLSVMHLSHHWQTQGKQFHADHKLFMELYEATIPEIDVLGEKVVGLNEKELTNYFSQLKIMEMFLTSMTEQESLTVVSHRAELSFLFAGEIVMSHLEEQGLLTSGIEQALGDILNQHEKHLYLLQQRNS